MRHILVALAATLLFRPSDGDSGGGPDPSAAAAEGAARGAAASGQTSGQRRTGDQVVDPPTAPTVKDPEPDVAVPPTVAEAKAAVAAATEALAAAEAAAKAKPFTDAKPWDPKAPELMLEDGSTVPALALLDEPLPLRHRCRQVRADDGVLYHHVGERVETHGDAPSFVRWTYRRD